MEHLRGLLERADTIELIDWPHQDIPATLIRAGYLVVGHEPVGYLRYLIVADEPGGRVFPLTGGGYLANEPIDALPDHVDIVNTFRPAEEQVDIARGAIEIGAQAVWIQPGETVSTEVRAIVEGAGLAYIEGIDIAEAVRALGIAK